MSNKTIEEVLQELLERVAALEAKVAELQGAATVSESGRVGA